MSFQSALFSQNETGRDLVPQNNLQEEQVCPNLKERSQIRKTLSLPLHTAFPGPAVENTHEPNLLLTGQDMSGKN